MLLQELAELKRRSRDRRKAYWGHRSNASQQPIPGGCAGKGQGEIVDPEAYKEEVFDQRQPNSSKSESRAKNKRFTKFLDFVSFEKNWTKGKPRT